MHPLDSPRVALLLGLLGCAGIGLALMAPSLFWLGAIICYVAGAATLYRYVNDLELFNPSRPANISGVEYTFVIGALLIEFLLPTFLVTQHLKAEPSSINIASVAVQSECRIKSLPISIAPQGVLHLLPINFKRFKLSDPWGLHDINNDRNKVMLWPDPKKLRIAEREHDLGLFVFRCDISNHGKENIADLDIPITFWFPDINKEKILFHPIVSPLDVGGIFTFYVINDCPFFVTAVMPDMARAKLSGSDRWQEISLDRNYRNPAEPIMMFFPTKTRWVNEIAQCN